MYMHSKSSHFQSVWWEEYYILPFSGKVTQFQYTCVCSCYLNIYESNSINITQSCITPAMASGVYHTSHLYTCLFLVALTDFIGMVLASQQFELGGYLLLLNP